MKTLKIFLENRIILLTTSLPVPGDEKEMTVWSPNRHQVRKQFRDFERKTFLNKLVMYQPDSLEKLFRSFAAGFTYVEAAGGRVINEKGELLMIFRYGKWDLPKGKLNKKGEGEESPVEAAVREVKEETGLTEVVPGAELPSTYHIFSHRENRILKRTYWFEMTAKSDQSLSPQTEEDISIAKWMNREERLEAMKNTYASLMELLQYE
ncbi:MAG: NUDIX hydrolase [Syntrophothermus sp.]